MSCQSYRAEGGSQGSPWVGAWEGAASAAAFASWGEACSLGAFLQLEVNINMYIQQRMDIWDYIKLFIIILLEWLYLYN